MSKLAKVRTCKYCGCTENNPCVNKSGETCCWFAPDVCSFCYDAWVDENVRIFPWKSKVPAASQMLLMLAFALISFFILYFVITEMQTAPEGWAFLKGDIHGHQAEPLQPKQAHRSDSE